MATGFEIIGLLGTVHSSIELLDRLHSLIQDFLHYDGGVADLSRRFIVDSRTLSHIHRVLTNLNASAENINLPNEDVKLHNDLVTHLVSLEQRLRFRVDKLAGGERSSGSGGNGGSGSSGGGFAAKSAWTLWRKRDLERLETELRDWIQRVYVIYSAIDAEVKTSRGYKATTKEERIGLLRNIFTSLIRQPIDESSLLISRSDLFDIYTEEPSRRVTASFRDTSTSDFSVIVEYISKSYSHNLTPDEVDTIGTAVRELAKVLYYSAPEQTRIPKCRGYFHEPETCRFGILYEIPPGVAPHHYVDRQGETKPHDQGKSKVLSLRDLLNRIPRFSFSDRLKFACELAKALVYVHLVGWVHKGVRPDNILILEDPSLPEARRFPHALPPPFLVGFEYARSTKTASDRRSDAEWHLNLYRHPKRQFLERNSEYTMAHDVYSFGVVLLELGLWGSNRFMPFQTREELFKNKTGEQVKEALLKLANGENTTTTAASMNKGVAFQMGDRYAGLVKLCLNIDGQQELPTAAFIQDVWLALDEMRAAMFGITKIPYPFSSKQISGMNETSINFEELEVEAWEDNEEGYVQSSIMFSKVTSQIVKSNIKSIANTRPFFDYTSFLYYAAILKIDIIRVEDLITIARLGSGATMTVFKGACPSRLPNQEVALKKLNLELPRTRSTINPNAAELYQLLAAASLEVRVLSNTLLRQHPNIVDLLGISWEVLGAEEGKSESFTSIRPILVVELAYQDYPTLDEYYKFCVKNDVGITMDTKISIISNVADGLAAIHMCGIIHGDVKPQNILLFREKHDGPLVAKICDFSGCQPPEDDDPPPTTAATNTEDVLIVGTEYWAAPEALPLPTTDELAPPCSGKVTRDHYSMGLVIYYILFEQMPFGDDGDNSEKNMERIANIKSNWDEMARLLQGKMNSCWKVMVTCPGAGEEITGVTRFGRRLKKFRELFARKKFLEMVFDRKSCRWVINWSGECRQYLLYFVMWHFLQHDPESRRQKELMLQLRVFLSNNAIAQNLRDIYLMLGWNSFVKSYKIGGFTPWSLSALSGDIEGKGMTKICLPKEAPKEHIVSWPLLRPEFRHHFTKVLFCFKVLDFNYFKRLPAPLQRVFMEELCKVANNPNDPICTISLLSLQSCREEGYELPGAESRDYVIEAAKLGSTLAKQMVLMRETVDRRPLPRDLEKGCVREWILDVLFPTRGSLTKLLLHAVPDDILDTVLHKSFETFGCRFKALHSLLDSLSTDITSLDSLTALNASPDSRAEVLVLACLSVLPVSTRMLLNTPSGMDKIRSLKAHGYNLLHFAADSGNVLLIRLLVQQAGIDVNGLSDDGVSPIELATWAMHDEAMSALPALGADYQRLLSARTLRYLANYGNWDWLMRLKHYITLSPSLSSGTIPFSRQRFFDGGFTMYSESQQPPDEPEFPPIFASILGDNHSALLALLELGCSPNLHTEFASGQFLAPLHVAANLRPLELAILLHHSADPNLRTCDDNRWTPLHMACVAYSIPRYMYPRVYVRDHVPEDSPVAGRLGLHSPEDYLHAKLFSIRLLVKEYNSDVNAQDSVGRTAVAHCMSNANSLEVARYLLDECGADIHISDFRGLSCLHRAVIDFMGCEYIEFCLQRGIDVNIKDQNGVTPLMAASIHPSSTSLDICRLLVRNGADILATDSNGRMCLHHFLTTCHSHPDPTTNYLFQTAASRNSLEPLLTAKDCYNQTLLDRIILAGDEAAEKYLHYFPSNSLQRTPTSLSRDNILGGQDHHRHD
ncbi:hypothetical protein BDD12DRAFT_906012 [Trichophaea hybrida]|nr:hypothetical protein BDD12DRAFT_906012 [Trichophaea hybrida]